MRLCDSRALALSVRLHRRYKDAAKRSMLWTFLITWIPCILQVQICFALLASCNGLSVGLSRISSDLVCFES